MVSLAHRISHPLAQIDQQPPFEITMADWRSLAQLARSEQLNAKAIGALTEMNKPRSRAG
ncbi:hypothetical protein GCM10023333_06400 [Ferrimonas pelagia]|uniref:Uncharacterized protein n=1 Tax=Ferrimonas pelagia TaxID=1177826 RepID=A0ABP9EG08_9GAMM